MTFPLVTLLLVAAAAGQPVPHYLPRDHVHVDNHVYFSEQLPLSEKSSFVDSFRHFLRDDAPDRVRRVEAVAHALAKARESDYVKKFNDMDESQNDYYSEHRRPSTKGRSSEENFDHARIGRERDTFDSEENIEDSYIIRNGEVVHPFIKYLRNKKPVLSQEYPFKGSSFSHFWKVKGDKTILEPVPKDQQYNNDTSPASTASIEKESDAKLESQELPSLGPASGPPENNGELLKKSSHFPANSENLSSKPDSRKDLSASSGSLSADSDLAVRIYEPHSSRQKKQRISESNSEEDRVSVMELADHAEDGVSFNGWRDHVVKKHSYLSKNDQLRLLNELPRAHRDKNSEPQEKEEDSESEELDDTKRSALVNKSSEHFEGNQKQPLKEDDLDGEEAIDLLPDVELTSNKADIENSDSKMNDFKEAQDFLETSNRETELDERIPANSYEVTDIPDVGNDIHGVTLLPHEVDSLAAATEIPHDFGVTEMPDDELELSKKMDEISDEITTENYLMGEVTETLIEHITEREKLSDDVLGELEQHFEEVRSPSGSDSEVESDSYDSIKADNPSNISQGDEQHQDDGVTENSMKKIEMNDSMDVRPVKIEHNPQGKNESESELSVENSSTESISMEDSDELYLSTEVTNVIGRPESAKDSSSLENKVDDNTSSTVGDDQIEDKYEIDLATNHSLDDVTDVPEIIENQSTHTPMEYENETEFFDVIESSTIIPTDVGHVDSGEVFESSSTEPEELSDNIATSTEQVSSDLRPIKTVDSNHLTGEFENSFSSPDEHDNSEAEPHSGFIDANSLEKLDNETQIVDDETLDQQHTSDADQFGLTTDAAEAFDSTEQPNQLDEAEGGAELTTQSYAEVDSTTSIEDVSVSDQNGEASTTEIPLEVDRHEPEQQQQQDDLQSLDVNSSSDLPEAIDDVAEIPDLSIDDGLSSTLPPSLQDEELQELEESTDATTSGYEDDYSYQTGEPEYE